MAVPEINLDFETFNAVSDLKKVGTYRYAEDAEVLMLGWAADPEDDPQIWIPSQDPMPYELKHGLTDPQVIKRAFNATFERRIFKACLDIDIPPEQWRCTAVEARAMGLPGSLDMATKALGFPQDKQKDKRGKDLIKLFCIPHKLTKNKPWTRATPATHPAEWEELMEYCRQDVRTERALCRALQHMHPLSEQEWRLYGFDQLVNDRGVAVDEDLIDAAIWVDEQEKQRLMERAGALTGLSNPNSRDQLLQWLQNEMGDEHGLIVTNVTKDTVEQLLDGADGAMKEMLEIRQQLAKSSVSKFAAAKRMMSPKTRCMHGTTQFYGAGRTGRWAGRGFQLHNLAKPPRWAEDWGSDEYLGAIEIVKLRDPELLGVIYGSPAEILSMLVRPVIVGKNGRLLGVVDFSAIEGRVNAWISNETWALEVYRTHGMIYEATAANMYRVPIESIQFIDATGKKHRGPNYFMRQKGKVATLLLGYQGAEGALITGGALKDGLLVEDLRPIVNAWRAANPNIVRNWYAVEDAAKAALSFPGKTFKAGEFLLFRKTDRWLEMKLPSGRKLRYLDAKLEDTGITYMGEDSITKQWKKLDTYGGKLVENACQAIARDLLAEAMLRLEAAGYEIVLHVHDEAVVELYPERDQTIEEMEAIMGMPVDWAPELPLSAAGYVTPVYRKD